MVEKRFYIQAGKYVIMNFIGESWILIFKHDLTKKVRFFTKVDDYIDYYNENEDDIYSIIGEAHQWEKKFEKYEFLLEYPPYTGFNHWRQTNYPMDERNDTSPEGYEEISNQWTSNYFGGMIYYGGCALLKGSAKSGSWFYAIGTIPCSPYGVENFPGPTGSSFPTVLLWMKISSVKIFGKYNCSFSKTEYGNLLLLLIILLNK